MEGIRREVERCDAFQGFLFNSAVGGGTGSGLGSLLLERMDADFGKKAVLSFNIFPSPRLSRSEVEPYDSVLATRSLIQRSEVSTIMDN
jgi:tubulin alpha